MAEFALGLTKMAVEGTVSRVKSAMDEEVKLRIRVQNDLVFITDEFEMMQSFLNAANKERANNPVVRTWVRHIRDLAFDVENCLEFVVHLDNKSTWSWLWSVLPGCMVPMRPLDEAIAEIQRLKARVEDVSHRNTRYNLIGDSGSHSNSKPTVATTVSSFSAGLMPDAGAVASFCNLRTVWEAAGKMRQDMGDLKKLITNEGSDLEVISVWGSPGASDLGVTHVLREAYNDPKICKEFTSRAWVKLMHPFNLNEFLKSLLTQFYAISNRASVGVAGFRKKMKEAVAKEDDLVQQVSQQKYLVIVEQLSSVVEWDAIKMYLPESTKGSRIIVTTKQLGLAFSCTGSPYQVSDLRRVSGDQSLCAFFNKKKGYLGKDKSGTFSSRMVQARDWIKTFGNIEEYSGWTPIYKFSPEDRPPHGVTSVWGIAGVGKSAPVRSFYYKSMIGDHELVRKYSWVDVPQPFNLTDFCRQLIMDFNSDDLEAKETAAVGMIEGQDPIQGCRKFLQEGNYFVVFDGLCSIDDWNSIKDKLLPKRIKGSIFVITNEKDVARHCVDREDRVFNVKGLDADKALDLFTKMARSKQMTSNETELAKLIIAKCGGLPKVIAAVGESLQAPDKWDKQSLEKLNANFMVMLEKDPRFHCLSGLFSWMQSYFDHCPDSLKPCIFYLSVFPLGHVIRQRHLLRRWIAEGYSRGTNGSTAEENAEKYFSQLVELSIIIQQQQEPPSSADIWKVNGFFREYIVSRPMQDNLVFALEGRCSHDWQRAGTGQHLTISNSWDREKIVFESLEMSRLRSLTVFGKWNPFFISTDVNMELLWVLDLENTSGVRDCDIEQIGKLLLRLKFLSLRGCEDITHLPRSLGGLKQLQTLDVKGTSIVILPSYVIKLHKLQYIRAGAIVSPSATEDLGAEAAATPAEEEAVQTTMPWSSRGRDMLVSCSWMSNKFRCIRRRHSGVKVPFAAGIGNLTTLHTLGVVNITISGKAILKELKKLTQLRKLAVSGINRKNWSELCSVISGYLHLETLKVRLDDNEEKQKEGEDLCCLDDISLPNTLKSLKLYGGNVHVSVVWMKQLGNNLKKARVQDLELVISTQEDIDSLVELACKDMFRHLCLKPIEDGELYYDSLVAPDLKIDCGSYKLVIVFGGWMPAYVEVLVVHCSSTESSLELSGLEKLANLKEVWLKGSYSDEVKEHLQQKVDELVKKPVLKLEDQQTQQSAPPTPCACLKWLLN